ncbi:type II toxin-antitoxin system VapC family toxin [Synechococcus sp. PCC 7336]|uniref:type II toxin-antitoxin system VapC family toxin n=1 Tax=Synechococcus sp. PCC 7336 TaxID=195250 RepID=UPI00034AF089|nr:type II toxin-antitoxin system VapC family toxin [Synechococcus sp. PCC 7336]
MFLLDTNIVSELRKVGSPKVNSGVEQWAKATPGEQTYISVVTIFEIERGILQAERKDSRKGKILREWFDKQVLTNYSERTIPLTTAIAQRCALLHVPDPMPDYDALIAATAIVHGLIVVTRNVEDFKRMGVKLLNPWDLSFKKLDAAALDEQPAESDSAHLGG